ncbi:MAG: hypothetical protein Q9190_007984, partial [Brigantiaea leucoxantha]
MESAGGNEVHSDAESAKLENGVDSTEDQESPGVDGVDDEGDKDLFGDEDEDIDPKRRKLDDEALDSGDEEGRYDRLDEDGIDGYGDEEDGAQEARQRTIMDVNLSRHPVPEPSDGE